MNINKHLYPGENINKFKSVKIKAEQLFSNLVKGDNTLIDDIQKEYLAGMTKQQLIAKFFPDQIEKSEHVNEMFIDMILEGIDSQQREERYQQTRKNLENTNSEVQAERGKRGGLKKQLSSELAKTMSQQPTTTLEQREFILQLKKGLKGNKDKVLQQIADAFTQKFGIEKSPGAIRGIIYRESKKQQEDNQKSSN